MLQTDIQIVLSAQHELPTNTQLTTWARAAYLEQSDTIVTLRLVDIQESHNLNAEYRQKNQPTNVLSFPMELPSGIDVHILGDIVICAQIVAQEAHEQGKKLQDHWAHMVVHGMLHLQGYDHITDDEADSMEALEVNIMTKMGLPSPYSP